MLVSGRLRPCPKTKCLAGAGKSTRGKLARNRSALRCSPTQILEIPMAKRLSRKELYELVWSEPLKSLAPRFGISDVALRKTCARAEIPRPALGNWAKKT